MALSRSVIERVPVLALDDYVFFPFTVASLHIFEPACRAMIDDAQATDRLLVVAGVPAGGRAVGGAQPVNEIAGLGKIVNVRPLDDGSREVFLHGIARVRLVRLLRQEPYRVVRALRMEDAEAGVGERWRQRKALRRVAGYLASLVRTRAAHPELLKILASTDDPGVLSFRLAAALVPDIALRQRILEMSSPADRLDTVIDTMSTRLMENEALEPLGDDAAPEPTTVH